MSTAAGPNSVGSSLVLSYDASDTLSFTPTYNILTYSEDFSNAAWSYSLGTWLSAGQATAPDGTSLADKIYEDATYRPAGGRYVNQTQTASNVTQTFSVFLKQAGRYNVTLGFDNTSTGLCYVQFDISAGVALLNSGAVADYTNISGTITDAGSGWYRCSVTATKAAANTVNNPYIQFFDDNWNAFWQGDESSGIYVWGAQLTSTSWVMPYYSTTSAAAANSTSWLDETRYQTNGTLRNTPQWNPAWSGVFRFDYSQSENVLVGTSSTFAFTGAQPYTLEAWVYPTRNPGASNWTGIFNREDSATGARDGYNLYFLGSATTTTNFAAERWVAGSSVFASFNIDSTVSVNAWHHIVATYDGTNVRLYRNGSLQSTSASQTTSITNTTKPLEIASRGGNFFDGYIALAKVYNSAITTNQIVTNFYSYRGRFGI